MKIVWMLLLALFLTGCAAPAESADPADPTADQTAMEQVYQKYDHSYDGDTFSVREVEALAGREDTFVQGVDISLASAILEAGGRYRDAAGVEAPLCKILADAGVDAVRIRLFHDPGAPDGTLCGMLDLPRVIGMIRQAKTYGLDVILDLHYSDGWADPGQQRIAYAWKDLTQDQIPDAVYGYTKQVLSEIRAQGLQIEYLQIGNEIDNGMIFPHGQIDWEDQEASFDTLAQILSSGSRASREIFPDCKIIVHTANGLYRWTWEDQWGSAELFFYEALEERGVDYDIVGASFYTFVDDTPLSYVSQIIGMYRQTIGKPVMVMETSYAYTYEWNEFTSNVFHTDKELAGYPVSFQGQTDLLVDLMEEVAKAQEGYGLGVCYWGGEWIPNTDEDMRTSWANQALFTYEGIATPTVRAFRECFPEG